MTEDSVHKGTREGGDEGRESNSTKYEKEIEKVQKRREDDEVRKRELERQNSA